MLSLPVEAPFGRTASSHVGHHTVGFRNLLEVTVTPLIRHAVLSTFDTPSDYSDPMQLATVAFQNLNEYAVPILAQLLYTGTAKATSGIYYG